MCPIMTLCKLKGKGCERPSEEFQSPLSTGRLLSGGACAEQGGVLLGFGEAFAFCVDSFYLGMM